MKKQAEKGREKGKKRVQGFQILEEECIWMKAGVVNFRLCDNAYDCYTCPFDKGMRKAMNQKSPTTEKSEQPEWVRYLQERYHGSSRPCRHALTGRIHAPKICTMNYECFHCPYDQMLDEMDLDQQIDAPSYRIVSGWKIAEGYYYHMGHSWARFEHGGRIKIGYDDFIVKLFGTMQTLDLPPLGALLEQNHVGWAFGRDDHKAAVLSPVTGTVLATNHKALEHPAMANHDPYQSGWLCIVEPKHPKRDLKGLYFGHESYQWIEKENKKLLSLIGPEYEDLAATGGGLVNDIYDQIPDLGWEALVRTFLRTEGV
jgi:glycine cleavage system H lipoate-binding protein